MGKGQLTPQSMFKLFQDFIVVIVTCKNEDPIKNEGTTGLRPIYVMFFRFLLISFQMKNNDDMWVGNLPKRKPIYPLRFARAWPLNMGQN